MNVSYSDYKYHIGDFDDSLIEKCYKTIGFQILNICHGKCNKCLQEGEMYELLINMKRNEGPSYLRSESWNISNTKCIFMCKKCTLKKIYNIKNKMINDLDIIVYELTDDETK